MLFYLPRYISDEGLAALTKSTNDLKKIVKTLLNSDLRDYGNLNDQKLESISGSIILQVQKVRNISAPKANEDSKVAPRLLKLQLTDGQTSYSALEVESIQALSINTKPGTKVSPNTHNSKFVFV